MGDSFDSRGTHARGRGAHFSPDSRKLVSCSKDPNAVVWDARTGDQLAVLRGHVTGIAVAEFSRDGERILTASSDHTLRLWDANTYETKVLMTGHDRAMRFAALSPDRKLVASGGDDRTVRLWDAESGAQVGVSSAHQWFVWFARFSADSKHLATASGDARLWRVPAGSQLSGWPAKEISQQLVSDAEASPDGASVAMVCADASVRLRSAASGASSRASRDMAAPSRESATTRQGASRNRVARRHGARVGSRERARARQHFGGGAQDCRGALRRWRRVARHGVERQVGAHDRLGIGARDGRVHGRRRRARRRGRERRRKVGVGRGARRHPSSFGIATAESWHPRSPIPRKRSRAAPPSMRAASGFSRS